MQYRIRIIMALVAGMTCFGCGSNRIQPQSLAELRTGVADTREQAQLAMAEANALARKQAVDRVVKLNKPALGEKDFIGAVARADVERWDNALAVLDGYINSVQYLTSPDRTAELEEAAVGFGNQLATGRTETVVPPGVGAAVTELGKAIVEARANRQALAIMGQTDGEVRQLLSRMALAIYDPDTNSGLRSTVLSNWNTAINGSDPATPQSRWVAAVEAGEAEPARRAIINDYLTMVDARDAQLAALDRLRASLLLLAGAHTSASRGQPADVDAIIARLGRHLDETQAVYKRFKKIADDKAEADKAAADQEETP